MLYGALLIIGIIALIVSRFLYVLYDIELSGNDNNNITIGLALLLDIISIVMIVYSIYYGMLL